MFYLDNGATSWPKPDAVYEAMDQSFRGLFSPKRGTAKAARAGAEKLLGARQVLATLIGAADPMRIAFTPGATYALNLAIQAFPWQAGDAVVMSAVEHHALSRPVRKVARDKGVRFHIVPYADDCPFDLAAYEALLQSDPAIKLVATTHASNVIGCVLPVAEIGRLARDHNILYLVDGAQTAGVLPIDVDAMNIDMLAMAGHKSLLGPPGVGALYVSERVDAVAPLNTFIEGGTGNDSGKHPMRMTLPDGIEVGTIPLPNIVALAEGVRWVMAQGVDKIHAQEMALLDRLLAGLQANPKVTIYGPTDLSLKVPVMSFNVAGQHPKALGERLFDEAGIALRAGFHCAPMAHEAIGTIETGGTLRASIGPFTTEADIDALLEALG